jgi:hypothetical protein
MCSFSNSLSYPDTLTSGDTTCLTKCHPRSVSYQCHFSKWSGSRSANYHGLDDNARSVTTDFVTVTSRMASSQATSLRTPNLSPIFIPRPMPARLSPGPRIHATKPIKPLQTSGTCSPNNKPREDTDVRRRRHPHNRHTPGETPLDRCRTTGLGRKHTGWAYLGHPVSGLTI